MIARLHTRKAEIPRQRGCAGSAMRRLIRPLGISESARRLLSGVAPRVKAVHGSGISIVVPGSSDIVYIGPPGSGLLPLHIVVRRRDLAHLIDVLGASDPASQCPSFDVDRVHVFHVAVRRVPDGLQSGWARAAIDQVASWLRNTAGNCGTGESVTAALSRHGRVRTTLKLINNDAPEALTALRALIGRGAGSTPAGDDMLVGALAHAFASGAEAGALVRAVIALAPDFERLTTATGATYLRAASQGAFGSDLTRFVQALPGTTAGQVLHRATRVAEHGATSGIDTLIGFVVAHEAMLAAGDNDASMVLSSAVNSSGLKDEFTP